MKLKRKYFKKSTIFKSKDTSTVIKNEFCVSGEESIKIIAKNPKTWFLSSNTEIQKGEATECFKHSPLTSQYNSFVSELF